MNYDLKKLTVMEKKALADRIMAAMMTVVETDELVDLFNQYTYTQDGMPEILPNEIEYLNDFFDGQPADYILSCLSEDAVLYKRSDEYFTMVDGILISIRDKDISAFLKNHGYIDTLATYLIKDGSDGYIEAIGNIMKEYAK